MGDHPRLNILLTYGGPQRSGGPEPWFRTLSHLLGPLGVKTFEASSGSQAMDLIEKVPIHLAVVDTRLPAVSGMTVLRLVQRIRDQAVFLPGTGERTGAPGAGGLSFRVQPFRGAAGQPADGGAEVGSSEVVDPPRKVPVSAEAQARKHAGPTVILLTPTRSDQLMQEALKFDAFSVLTEPVDLDLVLDLMARAMRRFHQNQWPM